MGAVMAVGVGVANGNLVVIFANELREQGYTPTAAAIEAFLADASRQVEPSSPLSRIASVVRGLVPTFGARRDAQVRQEGRK